jgi:D-psicose/D-tagatose/L-ribulose 3-epimerase
VNAAGRYQALGDRLRELGLAALALTARGAAANPIAADAAVRAEGARENLAAVACAGALGAEILCGPFLASPCVFTGAPPTDDERAWAVAALRDGRSGGSPRGRARGRVAQALRAPSRQHRRADRGAGPRAADHPRARMMYDTFHAHMEEKGVRAAITGCADVLAYVHVSENDRSTPGSGQVDWPATFAALRDVGYDGWLTIEALGDAHPRLAADMRIWRRAYDTEERLARDGLAFVRAAWE